MEASTLTNISNAGGGGILPPKNMYVSLCIQKVDQTSGKPLSGAEIGLYLNEYDETSMLTSGITDESGLCVLSVKKKLLQNADMLYYKELNAPDGYQQDVHWYGISIDEIQDTPIRFENEQMEQGREAHIILEVRDVLTQEPVPMAEFALYKYEDDKEPFMVRQTNIFGTLTFDNLVEGHEYFIRLVDMPEEYHLDKKEGSVGAVTDDTIVVEIPAQVGSDGGDDGDDGDDGGQNPPDEGDGEGTPLDGGDDGGQNPPDGGDGEGTPPDGGDDGEQNSPDDGDGEGTPPDGGDDGEQNPPDGGGGEETPPEGGDNGEQNPPEGGGGEETQPDGGGDGEQNPSNDENKNPSDEENSGEVPSSSHGDQSSTEEGASGELPPSVGSNSSEETTSSIDATQPPPSDTAKTEISDSGDRIDLTSKTESTIPKTGIAHWKYILIAGMVLSATMSALLAMLYFKRWKGRFKIESTTS